MYLNIPIGIQQSTHSLCITLSNNEVSTLTKGSTAPRFRRTLYLLIIPVSGLKSYSAQLRHRGGLFLRLQNPNRRNLLQNNTSGWWTVSWLLLYFRVVNCFMVVTILQGGALFHGCYYTSGLCTVPEPSRELFVKKNKKYKIYI